MINNDNQTPAADFACLAVLRIFPNRHRNRQRRAACPQRSAEQPARNLGFSDDQTPGAACQLPGSQPLTRCLDIRTSQRGGPGRRQASHSVVQPPQYPTAQKSYESERGGLSEKLWSNFL